MSAAQSEGSLGVDIPQGGGANPEGGTGSSGQHGGGGEVMRGDGVDAQCYGRRQYSLKLLRLRSGSQEKPWRGPVSGLSRAGRRLSRAGGDACRWHQVQGERRCSFPFTTCIPTFTLTFLSDSLTLPHYARHLQHTQLSFQHYYFPLQLPLTRARAHAHLHALACPLACILLPPGATRPFSSSRARGSQPALIDPPAHSLVLLHCRQNVQLRRRPALGQRCVTCVSSICLRSDAVCCRAELSGARVLTKSSLTWVGT